MDGNSEITNIQKQANIIDVISSYIPLTQKGKNYFGVCPFHEDHAPSMSVSEEKQIFKCFSCGASGNVFTFVKDYESVSFLEAVKIVADKCGLVFRGNVNAKTKVVSNKEEYEIMELALKYYQNNLNTDMGVKAREYLEERKLRGEAIKDFNIGLALDRDNSLNKLLLGKNYETQKLVELGLVNRNGEYINDVFQRRVIFPIHDLEGRVIGFTGRIYENSEQAKYINSKESVIFKKGQILFNYHRAKPEIVKKKEVVIVEGNMDAIRMYASGIKNVVALMGTSLTSNQVRIIKSMRAKVLLMFDNDEAGETATINNGNILSEQGIMPVVVRLSGEKDPDEYIIKNGVQAIINNIKNPISFLDFKLKHFKKNRDLSKTEDLVGYIKEIIQNIKDIPDDLTKRLTLSKMSEEYEVPLELLENELEKVSGTEKKQETLQKRLEKKGLSKYDIACRNIIYFMMNKGEYILKFKKELGYFSVKSYRNIANEIIYFYDNKKMIDEATFISYVADKDFIYDEVMDILKSVRVQDINDDAFQEFINVAIYEAAEIEIKNLREQLRNELDENKKLELASKLLEIKKGCVGK